MKVIASWDDGAVEDLRIAELMTKYSVRAIFYWPFHLEKSLNVTKIDRFLTPGQCLEIAKQFEVGSHTISHPHLTKIPLEEARTEIVDSRKKWQDLTGQSIDSFCYPRGYANDAIRQLVREAGYSNARNTAVGCLDEPEDPFWTANTEHVGIDRVEYTMPVRPSLVGSFAARIRGERRVECKRLRWQDYARLKLEEARNTHGSVYRIFGHSWEIERDNNWSELESLLRDLTA